MHQTLFLAHTNYDELKLQVKTFSVISIAAPISKLHEST